MAVPITFGFQSNKARNGHDGVTQLINCFPEILGDEGKTKVAIYGDPGFKAFANEAGSAVTRGLLKLDNILLWVVGTQLFEVQEDGSSTAVGGIGDTGKVSMSRNKKAETPQVTITTQGGLRFIYENGAVETLSDPDLPPPNANVFFNGRTVFSTPSGRLAYSEINDSSTIGALSFVTAEARPDGLVGEIVVGDELFAMGSKTIQVFKTTTNVDSPIAPLDGAPIARGCLAGGTVKEFDQSFAFVGNDGIVYRMNGYTPGRISNHYVERLIKAEPDKASLSADVFSLEGHEYYILSGTNFTVKYDANTQRWNDKKSAGLTRWRGQCIEEFAGKWIVGDHLNGRLYEIDENTFDENGADMVWEIIGRPQHDFPDAVIWDALYLDFLTGVGLNSSDEHDADPIVSLQYSDDGGRTWSNIRTASLGKIGEHNVTVAFYSLGEASRIGRVFKISVSAHVVRGFLGAAADLERVAA